ncbi:MAG: hypothetical protein WBD74_04145, partial [Candidatus Aquilonibacter sp.]
MIFTFATGSLIMAIGLLIVNVRSAHMRLMTLWVAANFALFGAWALYALRGEIQFWLRCSVGGVSAPGRSSSRSSRASSSA